MEAVTLSEAKIYVGTYGKYNAGSIFSKWFDLSDYSDKEEFYEACRELHKDEEDAEYMFQDWENIPDGLIGESWLSEKFFDLRDAVEDFDDSRQEAFFTWCNYKGYDFDDKDAADLVSSFEDEYQGEYDDEEDFAYQIIEECYDLPEFAKTDFDYAKFARDLFCGDYWIDNGFVFRCA
ncbi:antirestriction protein ArdA [Culturomica massiliensis]|uniref:antirestriction protein ArdA n=1 Tax=Culturomica massiliensis TaxID=1841857 RepID=UPI00266F3BA9|nr:antirestriction protein ArdA [Culturomica massiliensis]